MSFMQPQIIESTFWEFDTDHGTETIPVDVCDWSGSPCDESDELLAEFVNQFADYLSGKRIYSAERVDGYLWRLSAPGYMDCTEWTRGESVADCVAECMAMYGDEFDEEDIAELNSYL